MDVSKNSGFSPKSSILIGFSIYNHPFWGTTIFGNTYIASNGDLDSWNQHLEFVKHYIFEGFQEIWYAA